MKAVGPTAEASATYSDFVVVGTDTVAATCPTTVDGPFFHTPFERGEGEGLYRRRKPPKKPWAIPSSFVCEPASSQTLLYRWGGSAA